MSPGWSRRNFIAAVSGAALNARFEQRGYIMTLNGKLPALEMGLSLVHEHILVDFIGANHINPNRWNREDVVNKLLPYLLELKSFGIKTFIDCTPAFLGRDVLLLKRMSDLSAIQIITTTGYYGAVENKYLPEWAFQANEKELAQTWIKEFKEGIENTSFKPGIIKIGVDTGHLSELHKKLITAAGLTHLKTGLTICSHTGPALPALEQIEILRSMKIYPSAFVWTHAQNEPEINQVIQGAKAGTWISLDGIAWGDLAKYAEAVLALKEHKLLNQILISHDAGWYKPGEPNGGKITGYTRIFREFIPLLKQKGFSEEDLNQIMVINPRKAFTIGIKNA